MVNGVTNAAGEVAGFIDIGTNSLRLLLVRLNPNGSFTVLTDQKEMIRLGEGEFEDQRLQPEAMQRAVLVCRKFAELARANGAGEITAVATAATREAHNQREFLQLLHWNSGLDVRVVSGREEARLIYLGVSSGLNLGDKLAVFIDIGGGSTEVSIGRQREYLFLDSLKLGALRLTHLFLAGHEGPVTAAQYGQLQKHVRNAALRSIQKLHQYDINLAVGSSGTIQNLAEIAAHLGDKKRQQRAEVLSYANLRQVVELLCSLPVAERRGVPGINPDRADIIVGGAAILDTLMQEAALSEIRVSSRGLRDGLLMDYLARSEHASLLAEASVRERSVLQLGRNCGFDEAHARTVSRLALELFDSAYGLGLHTLGAWERELLHYAALLHDAGTFLSYTNHHAHSYYLIGHADLLGFDQQEIAIMAATALYHRKALPRKSHPAFDALDKPARQAVRVLSLLVRLAEALDRSHNGTVTRATFVRQNDGQIILRSWAGQDFQLELWAAESHSEAFAKTFGLGLLVEGRVEAEPAAMCARPALLGKDPAVTP